MTSAATETTNRVPIHTGGCQCGAVRFATSRTREDRALPLPHVPEGGGGAICRAGGSPMGRVRGRGARRPRFSRPRVRCVTSAPPAVRRSAIAKPVGGDHHRAADGRLRRAAARRAHLRNRHGLETGWLGAIAVFPGKSTADIAGAAELAAMVPSYQHPDHDTPRRLAAEDRDRGLMLARFCARAWPLVGSATTHRKDVGTSQAVAPPALRVHDGS